MNEIESRNGDSIQIEGEIKVGGVLSINYPTALAFQWYRNNEAIIGETGNTYTLLLTDQGCEIVCAIYIDGNILVSDPIIVDYFSLQVKPIVKEYIVKLYDKNMNFIKVLPASIITNDISYTESIDAGQGELNLNINLPIDTEYFSGVRYCKVYMSDNNGTNSLLLYSGWLSKINRVYSNNKENIQATFLSLFSLLEEVILRKNGNSGNNSGNSGNNSGNSGNSSFSKTGDPAEILKYIIDYFSVIYPNTLSYTDDSIESYGESITIKFDNISCAKGIKNLVNGLSYYLFVGADGIVHYHPTPLSPVHKLTYEKDIISLTIPEDTEQVKNVVQVIYKDFSSSLSPVGEGETAYTTINSDIESVSAYGYKEAILSRQDIETEAGANLYRDNYLLENKDMKRNIELTVNSLYPIETIHPGETIKIRNLGLDIDNAQVNKISYKYEQVQIQLEYYKNIAQEIFNK